MIVLAAVTAAWTGSMSMFDTIDDDPDNHDYDWNDDDDTPASDVNGVGDDDSFQWAAVTAAWIGREWEQNMRRCNYNHYDYNDLMKSFANTP